MADHIVRSWPKFFEPITQGIRKHELRKNDRNYQIGDVLWLHEFDPDDEKYTGRIQKIRITSMTSKETTCAVSNESLHPDYCIFSFDLVR